MEKLAKMDKKALEEKLSTVKYVSYIHTDLDIIIAIIYQFEK